MLFDSHAHLLLLDDKEKTINNMQEDNLAFIINAGTTLDDSKRGVDLAQANKNVYAMIAIYPEYASDYSDAVDSEIDKLAKNDKVVAFGEIGLDYHSEGYDKEKQKEVFVHQIKLAYKNNLPICIHCRNAASDVYEILKENKYIFEKGVLLHCFSEDMEYTKKFAELGCYFSFSGNITYKKVDTDRVKAIDINKILIETDSPYLSPMPVRGTKNFPANVKYTAQKIADILQMDCLKFQEIAIKNAKTFFKKIKNVEIWFPHYTCNYNRFCMCNYIINPF